MHDKLFSPGEAASSGILNVKRVWEVRADMSYQVVWTKGYPLKGNILLRTLAGEGYVKLKNGRKFKCLPETFINLDPSEVNGYGCVKPHWSFWWIECEKPSAIDFPANTVFNLRQVANELEILTESVRLLACGGTAAEEASASMNLLLRKWNRIRREGSRKENPKHEKMRNIITIMQASAENPLSIEMLAKKACLSEGRFRQVFINSTGVSPKSYYDGLRLNKSLAWLRDTDMKLLEIASRLNYSSAFHFSRAFKKHFGKPPSVFRPQSKR
ncbi:MAG: AraC family transcriptional regulator [Victivallales bacterium]|jgi:AraC-like DNA-binding protein